MNNLCACMGPIGNDPYCPCAMRQNGLTPSDSWTPEEIEEFKKALSKMFGWDECESEPTNERK